MKTNKIIYYAATGLLTALMLMSVSMYFFNHEEVAGMFTMFGYPTYIIYPLAIAKLLGLFALWYPKIGMAKEWAYAGFFFNFTLAYFAHYMVDDISGTYGALVALGLLILSYKFKNKIQTK